MNTIGEFLEIGGGSLDLQVRRAFRRPAQDQVNFHSRPGTEFFE
jgi:hypothetical protein